MPYLFLALLFGSIYCFSFSFAEKITVQDLGHGWYEHEKFGTYYDANQTGWYYHLEQGWMYVDEWNEDSTWMYIPYDGNESKLITALDAMFIEDDAYRTFIEAVMANAEYDFEVKNQAFGWMWTDSSIYPHLYNDKFRQWLYFEKSVGDSVYYNGPYYYDYSLGTFLSSSFIQRVKYKSNIWKEALTRLQFGKLIDQEPQNNNQKFIPLPYPLVSSYDANQTSENGSQPDDDINSSLEIKSVEINAVFFEIEIPKIELENDSYWSSLESSLLSFNTFFDDDVFEIEKSDQNLSIKWKHHTVTAFGENFTSFQIVSGDEVPHPDWEKTLSTWYAKPDLYGGSGVLSLVKSAKYEGGTSLNLKADNSNLQTPTEIDLTPVGWLTDLQTLEISDDNFSSYTSTFYGPTATDLTPLNSLEKLQTLEINSTNLTDLSPISNLQKLETLKLVSPALTDLSPLSSLENLKTIRLGGFDYYNSEDTLDFSLLDPLSNLIVLETLDLSDLSIYDNQMTQIEYLSKFSSLKELKLLEPSDEIKAKLEEILPNTTIFTYGRYGGREEIIEEELQEQDSEQAAAAKGVDDNGLEEAEALQKAGLIDLNDPDQLTKIGTYIQAGSGDINDQSSSSSSSTDNGSENSNESNSSHHSGLAPSP
jgi:hypothetical protein